MDNTQCKGYTLKAMKELGFSKEDIDKVMAELDYQFDMMSESQAEKFYNNN